MRHSLPSAADSAATAEGRLRPAVLPLGQSRVHTHSPEREGFPLGSHSTTAGSRTVCQPEAGGVGKRKASFHSVKCVPSPSHCQAPNQGQAGTLTPLLKSLWKKPALRGRAGPRWQLWSSRRKSQVSSFSLSLMSLKHSDSIICIRTRAGQSSGRTPSQPAHGPTPSLPHFSLPCLLAPSWVTRPPSPMVPPALLRQRGSGPKPPSGPNGRLLPATWEGTRDSCRGSFYLSTPSHR